MVDIFSCSLVFVARCYTYVRPMPSHGVRPSVQVSVTLVYSIETSEHIVKLYSPDQSFLFFHIKPYEQYSDEDTKTGASNAGWV